MNFEAILKDHKLPRSVRYAMLRTIIVEKAKNRKDKRELLFLVGYELKGRLVPGSPNYWLFEDGTKARFQ